MPLPPVKFTKRSQPKEEAKESPQKKKVDNRFKVEREETGLRGAGPFRQGARPLIARAPYRAMSELDARSTNFPHQYASTRPSFDRSRTTPQGTPSSSPYRYFTQHRTPSLSLQRASPVVCSSVESAYPVESYMETPRRAGEGSSRPRHQEASFEVDEMFDERFPTPMAYESSAEHRTQQSIEVNSSIQFSAPSSSFAVPEKNKDSDVGSMAVELLTARKHGLLNSVKIGQIISKHKEEANFYENYQHARDIMYDKIGELHPSEGSIGWQFIHNCNLKKEEAKLEKMPVNQLFQTISMPLNVNTEYSAEFRKKGYFWKSGKKSSIDMYSYPADTFRCISAVIKYLIYEITSDPEDISFFTFKKSKSSERVFLQLPTDVYQFVQDYVFESVGIPAKILHHEYVLETLRSESYDLYLSLGTDLVKAFADLKRNANTFRIFVRERASKILSDHRYKRATRDGVYVNFISMTPEEKSKWKSEFEKRKADVVQRMNS